MYACEQSHHQLVPVDNHYHFRPSTKRRMMRVLHFPTLHLPRFPINVLLVVISAGDKVAKCQAGPGDLSETMQISSAGRQTVWHHVLQRCLLSKTLPFPSSASKYPVVLNPDLTTLAGGHANSRQHVHGILIMSAFLFKTRIVSWICSGKSGWKCVSDI